MDLWPPIQYRHQGALQGLDETILDSALDQAHAVQSMGRPAILSLAHLAEHTDAPYAMLRQIVGRRIDPYRSFPIKKRAGGYRIICIPAPPLLRVQRWIQRYVLQTLKPHAASYAYSKGSSHIRCARMHAGSRWLLKIDIRRFFESIDEVQVYRLFRKSGYEALLAFELARLTTRLPDQDHKPTAGRWVARHRWKYTLKAYESQHVGHLPQGAPTSPMLANLVMHDFDNLIGELCAKYRITYTRYSDDMAFSSADPAFKRNTAVRLMNRIYGVLASWGLQPKTTKTKVVPPGARHVILGLTVNDGVPRLTRQVRRRIECHVHYASKLGYIEHARNRGFASALGCFHHIQGLVAYACQVEPSFGAELRRKLGTALPPF